MSNPDWTKNPADDVREYRTHERLTALETSVREAEKERAEIKGTLASLLATMKAIEIALAARRECPAPGSCLTLQTKVGEFQAWLEKTEKQTLLLTSQLDRAKGVLWVLGLGWPIVIGLILHLMK